MAGRILAGLRICDNKYGKRRNEVLLLLDRDDVERLLAKEPRKREFVCVNLDALGFSSVDIMIIGCEDKNAEMRNFVDLERAIGADVLQRNEDGTIEKVCGNPVAGGPESKH